MNMSEKDLMQVAEKAAGILAGKSFDVYVRGSSTSSVEVKEQRLEAYEEARTWGVGVRVLIEGGRVGFAYSTGSPDAVEEAAHKALTNAGFAEPDEYSTIPVPPAAPYPSVLEFDEGVSAVSEQDKISRAMTVEKAAMDFDPRVTRVRKASVSFTESHWALLNSAGVKAAARGTYFNCGIMAVAEEGGDSQIGYGFDYKRRLGEVDYIKAGREASEKAIGLLGARKAPSGLFPVILENIVASEFLGVLAASFSAESLIKGRSLLADKVGKPIASDLINIYDDGLMPGGLASRPFDDEGAPSQRTPLVAGGVLMGFLHSAYTAKRVSAKSTGNAVRGGFRSQPSVGMTNLYLEKGTASKESLIASISNGLMVQEVLGMHTANPISGDFSVGVAGQWIEGGKIVHPVREAAIAGNILGIFSGVEAVADDLRFMGRIGAPALLLKPISVSGS
jgi:PmbA protein